MKRPFQVSSSALVMMLCYWLNVQEHTDAVLQWTSSSLMIYLVSSLSWNIPYSDEKTFSLTQRLTVRAANELWWRHNVPFPFRHSTAMKSVRLLYRKIESNSGTFILAPRSDRKFTFFWLSNTFLRVDLSHFPSQIKIIEQAFWDKPQCAQSARGYASGSTK